MKLLNLPPEVLMRIADFLDDGKVRPRRRANQGCGPSILSLNRTCRQMNVLTERVLFRRLDIPFHFTSPDKHGSHLDRPRNLLAALEKAPQRYAFIHDLAIDIEILDKSDSRPFKSLQMLLEKSTNVKRFCVIGGEGTLQWSSLLQLLHNKQIHRLELGTAVVDELTKPDRFLGLESLSISGEIKIMSGDDYDDSWWKNYELPVNRWAISSCEKLDVICEYDDGIHPCTILPIVQWIKSLRSIDLNFCGEFNAHTGGFELKHLQHMLDLHAESLERITLTASTLGVVPDFRHFPQLRDLEMSHYDIIRSNVKSTARKLAAPQLANFVINFDVEDCQCDYTKTFDDEVQDWIEHFSKEYRAVVPVGGIEKIGLTVLYCDEDIQEDWARFEASQGLPVTLPICF